MSEFKHEPGDIIFCAAGGWAYYTIKIIRSEVKDGKIYYTIQYLPDNKEEL